MSRIPGVLGRDWVVLVEASRSGDPWYSTTGLKNKRRKTDWFFASIFLDFEIVTFQMIFLVDIFSYIKLNFEFGWTQLVIRLTCTMPSKPFAGWYVSNLKPLWRLWNCDRYNSLDFSKGLRIKKKMKIFAPLRKTILQGIKIVKQFS